LSFGVKLLSINKIPFERNGGFVAKYMVYRRRIAVSMEERAGLGIDHLIPVLF
jgi:hypothetical protein